jgi:hypothetical protein
MLRILLPTAALLASFVGSAVRAAEYNGMCEASAGAFLDDTHFVVASDETNRLQLYERGNPNPTGDGIDMAGFTSFDKSDLEGAALIGDRVYWISSHSFNSQGEDKAKRKVFFATKIVQKEGKPTLVGIGQPIRSLRDAIARAAGVEHSKLNIEGLAATPDGGLLIGLRAPLRGDDAIVVPFRNPAAVVDQGAQPEFGEAKNIKLQGRGIRSMDLVSDPTSPYYVIVGGPVADSAEGFALFRWAGPDSTGPLKDPVPVEGVKLAGIKPEGAMAVPGQALVQLLSDDGDICSDENDPPSKRRFRSIDVKPRASD